MPTVGFQMNIVNPENSNSAKEVLIYDCSGLPRHRINWKVFYPEVDA